MTDEMTSMTSIPIYSCMLFCLSVTYQFAAARMPCQRVPKGTKECQRVPNSAKGW